MGNESRAKYQSEKQSWMIYHLFYFILFCLFGLLVSLVKDTNFNFTYILIGSVIISVLIIHKYCTYVKFIEFHENEIIFQMYGRIKRISKNNLQIKEKLKFTKGMSKYKKLTIWDDNNKIKIDSDEFSEYHLILDQLKNINCNT